MLELGTRRLELRNIVARKHPYVWRINTDANRPKALAKDELFLFSGRGLPAAYRAIAFVEGLAPEISESVSSICLPKELGYLGKGDIVAIDPQQNSLRVLYRRNSSHNSLLVTERCNHYCLMCSQPPKDVDDSWLIDEMIAAISLMDPETHELGFTGGEPTLLGEKFLGVLRAAKSFLPYTSLHILSNGRAFADRTFVKEYAAIGHHDLMVGIPIYSDVSTIHDYVVQADGAFDETIRGILNLKELRQQVEIRVVIHQQTFPRLRQLAEFLARNLTFVDHVALMGLEITGFTRANLPILWVDPLDYRSELYDAVTLLSHRGMHVSIYNHQLCLLDPRIWKFSRQSISDWKNEYLPQCGACAARERCGGFFSSAKHKHSANIIPFTEDELISADARH